jgi:hypothetical protein
MLTCLQKVQEINLKKGEVKGRYYSAVKTYAIIKILRRDLT